MPIYNEDPLRTTAALQAMAEALARIDAHRAFEIVILSDSTNADAWIRETLSVEFLAQRAAAQSCRFGIGGDGKTSRANPAISRISWPAGAGVTIT